MRHYFLLLTLMLPLACTSTQERLEEQDELSRELAQDLVRQLRARTDLRSLRLVVQPFEDKTKGPKTQVKRRRIFFSKEKSKAPAEFREQLIDALAPNVRVVDAASGMRRPAADGSGLATREAILVATYSAPDDDLVTFRAQVIDAESKTVLATVQRRWDA